MLRPMYAGSSETGIAESSEVTAVTARTRVKAVLRKLEVETQLAAVATLGTHSTGLDQRAPPALPSLRQSGAPTTA